jgi:quinol monooxygenase YgiN
MPVGVLQQSPGASQETYEAVAAKINAANDPPEGLIIHTAGAAEGGGWRIFDVWESREAFDRFMQERLMPAMQELFGDQMPAGGQPPEIYELHDLVRP